MLLTSFLRTGHGVPELLAARALYRTPWDLTTLPGSLVRCWRASLSPEPTHTAPILEPSAAFGQELQVQELIVHELTVHEVSAQELTDPGNVGPGTDGPGSIM